MRMNTNSCNKRPISVSPSCTSHATLQRKKGRKEGIIKMHAMLMKTRTFSQTLIVLTEEEQIHHFQKLLKIS